MGRRRAADNVVYKAELNASQLKKELASIKKSFDGVTTQGNNTTKRISSQGANDIRQLGFAFERFGVQGVAAFGEIIGIVGPAGLAIGGLLLTITKVTQALTALATAAVQAFQQVIESSVATTREFEAARAQFSGIFDDAEVGEAVFERLRNLSRELGVDAVALGRAFLPEVGSLDQLEEIVELSASLARFQPEQGALGARIALQGALEGTGEGLRSLQRRFEVPQAAIDRIKTLQDELGAVDGLILGLSEELERAGRDFESLGSTLDLQIGRAQERLTDLQDVVGRPIVEELQSVFGELIQVFDENEDELRIIANALGRAVAAVVEVIGDRVGGLLEDLDVEKAQELANALVRVGEALAMTAERLLNVELGSGLDLLITLANTLEYSIFQVNAAWVTFQAIGEAAIQAIFNRLGPLAQLLAEITGEITGLDQILPTEFKDPFEVFETTRAAGMAEIMLDYSQRTIDARKETDAFADSLNKNTDALEGQADTFLANERAQDKKAAAAAEAAEAEAQAAEKTAEFNEKALEAQIDRARKLEDIARNEQRQILDLEIESAQKREDIARKNSEKITDIRRKNAQKVEDAALDLVQDEEDAVRDFNRDREDLEQELADRRIDIETEYQRELRRIRSKFELEAQEAIRANDAIAFLRAQRNLEAELTEAKESKKEETENAAFEAERKRQELKNSLDREIEDARIANERKLQDLRVALERELQEQRISYQRELQEQAIAEQQKREEIARTFAQQREDAEIAFQRKMQDLQRQYQQELATIRQFEEQKTQLLLEAERRRASLRASIRARSLDADSRTRQRTSSGRRSFLEEALDPTSTKGTNEKLGGKRVFGGPVRAGLGYIVGETGAELFYPNTSGRVISNSDLRSNAPLQAQAQQIIDRSKSLDANISLLDPTSFSPEQLRILKNIFLPMLLEAFN